MTLKLAKNPPGFWADFPPPHEKAIRPPKPAADIQASADPVRDDLLNTLTLAAAEAHGDSPAAPVSPADLERLADALLDGARQGKLLLNMTGEPAKSLAGFVLGMPVSVWKFMRDRVPGARGCEVAIGPTFSAGGKALSAGLKILQVQHIDAWVPDKGTTMDFRDPDPATSEDGPWHPTLTLRGRPGAQLQDVKVSLGAEVAGDERVGEDVLVHFENADGDILKKLPVERLPRAPEAAKVQPIDLQAVEIYRKEYQAEQDFKMALKQDATFRELFPRFNRTNIFNKLIASVPKDDPAVIDLSCWWESDETAVAAFPQSAWDALRSHPQAHFTKVKCSPWLFGYLKDNAALETEKIAVEVTIRKEYEARKAFTAALKGDEIFCKLCPDCEAEPYFDSLVSKVSANDAAVLDLTDNSENEDTAVTALPRQAWNALRSHPKLAQLAIIRASRSLCDDLAVSEELDNAQLQFERVD
ncbi:MAG TPA: hypothetical protein VL593_06245 [Ramlibacter sp.]|jgi:hypothetical protein|nr:hypothetical protein [Ramlibacter sp.]